MKRASSYNVLQLSIGDVFRYSVLKKDSRLVIENAQLKNMLYSMLSSNDKTVTDTIELTAENIASAAAISIPYNSAMRQIFLEDKLEGDHQAPPEGEKQENPEGDFEENKDSKVDKEKLYIESLVGPDNTNYYLKTILYIDIGILPKYINEQWLGNLYNGITLCFEKDPGKGEEFVLFERSASQQRQNVLVLINKRYYYDEAKVTPSENANEAKATPSENADEDKVLPSENANEAKATPSENADKAKVPPLKERIRCGLNDTDDDFKVYTSKYAAYRALLLTSGICINTRRDFPASENTGAGNSDGSVQSQDTDEKKQDKPADKLNENSVMVIDDYTIKKWNDLCKKYLQSHTCDDEKVECDSAQAIEEGKEKKLTLEYEECSHKLGSEKLFDGEGLISVKMSELISEELKSKEETKVKQYNSFQVRMPFVKGVLHKVDFHRILCEIFGTENCDDISITDYYGISHKLSDVHIILTLSMFKMYKNYESLGKKLGNGKKYGWERYWEKFKEYDHCLLVSNTDGMFDPSSKITISNYQFLSTLDVKNEETVSPVSLISPSMNALYTMANSVDSLAVSTFALDRTPPDDVEERSETSQCEESLSEKSEEEKTTRISNAMFVSRCPAIINTSSFRRCLSVDSFAKHLSYGHLIEHGVMRYLSGDLMQMICQLADKAADDKQTKAKIIRDKIEKCINEALAANRADDDKKVYYYAPGVPKMRAIIDRNPHLTRNEHVYADPLVPEKGSLRKKWFGHLTGVVMLQVDRHCALQRLGGADFDGDIARLFFDPSYIEAAKGCVDTKPLLIPSVNGKAVESKYDHEAIVELIKRSSRNRVGELSNHAFRTSLYTYGSRNTNPKAKEDLVLLSCAIGLEIDSVKTGVKPDIKTEDLTIFIENPDFLKGGKSDPAALMYFLGFKDHVKKDNTLNKKTVKYKLTPIYNNGGATDSFSMVEDLPYIFDPIYLDVDEDYKAESWAECCRKMLYSSSVVNIKDKKKSADEENDESEIEDKKTERVFKLIKDPYTAKKASPRSLRSLLEVYNADSEKKEEKNIQISTLFAEAYAAARIYQYNSTRKGNEATNEKFDVLQRLLIQRYGNYRGTFLADILSDKNERIKMGNLRQVSHIFFKLIKWQNMPFAEIRKSRFVSLAADHEITLTEPIIGAFSEQCCKFNANDPDSWLFAKWILENDAVLPEFDIEDKKLTSFDAKGRLFFESDIDIDSVKKENIETVLSKCLRSINYSANLEAMADMLEKNEIKSVKREELEELCSQYSIRLPGSRTYDKKTGKVCSNALIDKFFEFYSDEGKLPADKLRTLLKNASEDALDTGALIIKHIVEGLQRSEQRLSNVETEWIIKLILLKKICGKINGKEDLKAVLVKKYNVNDDSDHSALLRKIVDGFKSSDKRFIEMDTEGVIDLGLYAADKWNKSYCAIESLRQKLHTDDYAEASEPHSERLKKLVSELYDKPEVDWLTKEDEDKRRDDFIEAWESAQKLEKNDIDEETKEELSVKLVSILCDPKNYQILPAYLDYCRSTAETTMQNHNADELDGIAQNIVAEFSGEYVEKIKNILNNDNDSSKDQENETVEKETVEETLEHLVRDFVSKINKKGSSGNAEELPDYITPAKTVSEYIDIIGRQWVLSPSRYKVIGDWMVIGDKAVRLNTAMLYCIIRAAITLHKKSISCDDAAHILLGCCHPKSNGGPVDGKEILYSLFELRYNGNKKLGTDAKNKPYDELLPSDDIASFERFILQYLRAPLYDNLKRLDTIRLVKDFEPEQNCGFLDGSQCAEINILTAEELKKHMEDLSEDKKIIIKAKSVLDGAEKSEIPVIDRLKSSIEIETTGINKDDVIVELVDDEKMINCMEKALWLYSVRFRVKLKDLEIADGAITRLRLPYDEKEQIYKGYKDIATECVSVKAVIDGKNTAGKAVPQAADDDNSEPVTDEEKREIDAGKDNTKKEAEKVAKLKIRNESPLENFIWGYKKYTRKEKKS